ncbi:MAG: sulfatase-like hydrolase/transferase [Victivallaceae bacterium]|nr:sulfatase-like hydrolase/transferase [Victivallaceae bacterium]
MGLYALLLLEVMLLFTPLMDIGNLNATFFILCISLTYPLLYMLPTVVIIFVAIYILRYFNLKHSHKIYIIYVAMVLLSGTTMLLLFADYKIYSMFNFHINGFVLNLIFTPGGIESMGASNFDTVIVVIFGAVIFGLTALLLWLTNIIRDKLVISLKKELLIITVLLVGLISLGTVEKIYFSYSNYENDQEPFYNSQHLPFYIITSMNHIFRVLGIHETAKDNIKMYGAKSSLHYPLKAINVAKIKKPLNIVWLVAESWRADTLNAEIMPATTIFAEKCLRFHNHYSAGNGTRMAMFGMFYGLYGSYWDAVLAGQRPPVLMTVLQTQHYQFQMYTSAKFTYPEFDKTIFANIKPKDLHQSGQNGGFVNDRKNIGEMLAFIKNRNKKLPFMTFMFFESPHAPYTFPDNCIVKKDYLPTFHYTTVDIATNIDKIKNRYLNSVNHLDTQLDRMFKFLKQEQLLKNTIVIVTGDHGEEFMEKGHWGHNQSFHEEQVRPPLLLYVPDKAPRDINYLSSHLDIAPTVAALIGITNPPKDYSLGYNLLGDKRRTYTVCASWDTLCYINDKFKYELSPSQYNTMVTINDAAVNGDEKKLLNKTEVFDLMKNASRFYTK